MKSFLIVICCIFSLLASYANAGVASKTAKEVGEEIVEYGAKKTVQKAGKRIALKEITEKYGKETAETVIRIAKRHSKDPDELAEQVLRYKKWLNLKGERLETLVDFAARTGEKGAFLVNRFHFDSLYNRGWMNPGAEGAITEAWRLVDDKAIGGSWQRLRMTLQTANIKNGSGRDFCEELFEDRAKAGRIPGFAKGAAIFSGHAGDKRQGIDFIAPTRNGQVRIIEFSTGKKPAVDNPEQMTWEWIRKNLTDIAENASVNQKINLRDAGFPNELSIVKNLRDPKFPIEKYVSREFYAPELDREAIKSIGNDIKAFELP